MAAPEATSTMQAIESFLLPSWADSFRTAFSRKSPKKDCACNGPSTLNDPPLARRALAAHREQPFDSRLL